MNRAAPLAAILTCLAASSRSSAATLLAYYPFEEGGGRTTADAAGKNPPAALVGEAAFTAEGRYGLGIEMDGGDAWVDAGRAILDTSRSYSVAAWIRLDEGFASDFRTALSQDGEAVSGFYLLLRKSGEGAGTLALTRWRTADGRDDISAGSGSRPAPGKWIHLAGVQDCQRKKLQVWVDGKLAGERPYDGAGGSYEWKAEGHTAIGRGFYRGKVDPFLGRIDEVYLFEGVLTGEEIGRVMEDRWLKSPPARGKIVPPAPEVGGRDIDLSRGWRVLQDVHDLGETLGLFRRDEVFERIGPCISGWEPIAELKHLQLLLAPQPYFGRELRWFNAAPWWYRLEFPTPEGAEGATLRFEGVDYYAKAWLNDRLLGEHEGYADPFEFEVGGLLEKEGKNVLIVKVSSPWDPRPAVAGKEGSRFWNVERNMIKGTYEHADTFIQRDVNPVGIWRPVHLLLHGGVRTAGRPAVATTIVRKVAPGGVRGEVGVSWPVAVEGGPRKLELVVSLRQDGDGREVARSARRLDLAAGTSVLEEKLELPSPKLWSTWDRGEPALYKVELELRDAGSAAGPGRALASACEVFGFRTVELRRTERETTFLLNGSPIFLRGATYWPDIYVSAADRSRYERDVAAAVRAGLNAFRIHVHVENDSFYEICDRRGIAVIQDSDLNWVFPTDEAFTKRAVAVFGAMVKRLRNHPSIFAWICMNEADGGREGTAARVRPGPQLVAEAHRLDPSRPTIKSSWDRDDPESGDGHDYRGSLGGGSYVEIDGSTEKLSTEFGVDAPPAAERIRLVPRMAERLRDVVPRIAELHDYQYRLVKHYVEHYRLEKYAPCSGYFLFMWVDFSPQSFYGVYDWWGHPKAEGIGGGLRALEESSLPVGIFLEYRDGPIALHAVNDTLEDLGECVAEWSVADGDGAAIAQGTASAIVGPDSRVKVRDLSFPLPADRRVHVELVLRDGAGRPVARNVYRDPFHPQPHPRGHPGRIDNELGMRLWWAGLGR